MTEPEHDRKTCRWRVLDPHNVCRCNLPDGPVGSIRDGGRSRYRRS